MSLATRRRAARRAFVAGFVLHSLAVLWLWATWDPSLRGSILVWVDFPSALVYLNATRQHLLVWSLAVGGLQWATIAALLTMLIGRTSVRAAPPSPAAPPSA